MNELTDSIPTKSNKWNQNAIHFLVKQKFMFYIYIYIHTHKSFSTTLDKDLRKNIKKKDGEIREYKLNDMGTLDMKYKK